VDATSSNAEVRKHTGHLIGYVLDRLVGMHAATRQDDSAAQALHDNLLGWADGARRAAACRLTDPDCEAALKLLDEVAGRLRTRPAADVTMEWLRAVARDIDKCVGDELRRLSSVLCPPWAWDPENYDPDNGDVPETPKNRVRPEIPSISPETPSGGHLGLVVDESHGEVRRSGSKYERIVAHFNTKSAEWYLFCVAFRTRELGATEARVLEGYPGSKKRVAMRQARARARAKLGALGISFEDGYPLRLKSISDGA
jgi:hypothetical protein